MSIINFYYFPTFHEKILKREKLFFLLYCKVVLSVTNYATPVIHVSLNTTKKRLKEKHLEKYSNQDVFIG